jgi:folate-dependent phosphoribosylglycinamide formyltransferase PurN
MRPWVTFFSQTGSEIYNISKRIGRSPDLIITNKQSLDDVNKGLLNECSEKLFQVSAKPDVDEYQHYIPKDALVTLHGWLRIIPAEVCEQFEIYNLHPANIVLHPHLKGKDPQERAARELLRVSGNTLHRCTTELDAGEIQLVSEVVIESLLPFEVVYQLHKDATNLWCTFLEKRLE